MYWKHGTIEIKGKERLVYKYFHIRPGTYTQISKFTPITEYAELVIAEAYVVSEESFLEWYNVNKSL